METTGQVQTENDRGQWVPAIPEPYYLLFRKECCAQTGLQKGEICKKKFWRTESYRAHYALKHILGL